MRNSCGHGAVSVAPWSKAPMPPLPAEQSSEVSIGSGMGGRSTDACALGTPQRPVDHFRHRFRKTGAL